MTDFDFFLAFVSLTCCFASSCVLGVFGVTARMAWHEIAAIRIVNGNLHNIVIVKVFQESVYCVV